MEDNLLRIFSVLISVLILFILPLYITFEKIDDISYSLALKITSNFVDNVTSKGYVSQKMYTDFIAQLDSSGITYDVKLEHVSKKYYPVYYKYDDNGNVVDFYDYIEALYKSKYGEEEIYTKFEEELKNDYILSYKASDVKYTTNQILKAFDENRTGLPYSQMSIDTYKNIETKNISYIPYMYANYKLDDDGKTAVIDDTNKIYTMNKGDEFSVRIKNSSTTIASVLFNAFTIGVGGNLNNTKIYINYGGTIQSEEYKDLKSNI